MNSKKLSLLFALIALTLCFTSCETEPEDTNPLHGTWNITEISLMNNWFDVSVPVYKEYQATLTFGADNTYTESGYTGNNNGTYEENGDNITTSVGTAFVIKSLNDSTAEFSMTLADGKTKNDIRLEKKK